MFTRKDYLEGKCTHREYYRQFITPELVSAVKACVGHTTIRQSKDPHFNDIPLCVWDSICVRGRPKFEGVCVVKEIAEQIREGTIK